VQETRIIPFVSGGSDARDNIELGSQSHCSARDVSPAMLLTLLLFSRPSGGLDITVMHHLERTHVTSQGSCLDVRTFAFMREALSQNVCQNLPSVLPIRPCMHPHILHFPLSTYHKAPRYVVFSSLLLLLPS